MGEQLLNPRTELLAVWRRWMAYSGGGGGEQLWDVRADRWGDDNHSQRNCIMDAELLECLLLPQFSSPRLSLEGYTEVDVDVQRVLNPPDHQAQGRLAIDTLDFIVHRLDDFFRTYDGTDGAEIDFRPRSYVLAFDEAEGYEESFPPVVDAYTLSLSVSLQTKYLLDRWRERVGDATLRRDLGVDLENLRAMVDRRLTAALEGLRRSFAVYGGGDKETWLRYTGRPWPSDDENIEAVRKRLNGFHQSASGVFECGWSWGQVPPDSRGQAHAPDESGAPPWYAEPLPYFYFTVTALDGIADLLSSKVRGSGLLNDQQTLIASRLSFYWELTQQYWRAVALAPSRQHMRALEDVPWQTTDGVASEYYTAYVLRIITASPDGRRSVALDADEHDRLVRVLEELAQRARISRRALSSQPPTKGQIASAAKRLIERGEGERIVAMLRDPEAHQSLIQELAGGAASRDPDPALSLHDPGISLRLRPAVNTGAACWEGKWRVYELAPQLLKLTGILMKEAVDRRTRDRLRHLADDVWTHLLERSIDPRRDGGAFSYAWDEAGVLRGRPREHRPVDHVGSWYITERVAEALVSMEEASRTRTGDLVTVKSTTDEMLEELRWLIDTNMPDQRRRKELDDDLRDARAALSVSPALGLAKAVRLAQDVAAATSLR